MSDKRKVHLGDHEMPKFWYNIMADMPNPPAPVINPGTGKPASADDRAPVFCPSIIAQEMSTERLIEIPKEVRDVLKLWRPSPLYRAIHLEKLLDTPAHIYYKYEGVSPAGSHKPNTAVAQAYYNKLDGVKRIATETGAGQWGSSMCFAGASSDSK
jgi:tryptophan synthase beta chain